MHKELTMFSIRTSFIFALLLAGLACGPAYAGGAARGALKRNKYGGQDGKVEGGKKTYGGGDTVVPKEERIDWYMPDAEVFEAAQKDKQPVVLYFPAKDVDLMDASMELHGKDIAKVSAETAIFVIVQFNPDRTPGFESGSPVPTSKYLSPNLSRDYQVTKQPSFIVCDWHGNEYQRWTKVPGEKDVLKQLEGMPAAMEELDKKLAVTLEEAKKAKDANDLKGFFKAAGKNFKTGVVGLASAEETTEVNRLLEEKPADGAAQLKELAKTYRDTDLEKEIDEAQKILKG
jgi:hypothetical protein